MRLASLLPVAAVPLLGLAVLAAPRPQADGPLVVSLSGRVTRTDQGTYQEHAFDVPAGTTRIDVSWDHARRGQGTELEVGLRDPERFRGTSRFSKRAFHLAEAHASPSYLPGPLPPGRWYLTLAVPTVGADSVTWEATIRLTRGASADGVGPVARTESGWYAGDFHAHTMHSDGYGCRDTSGRPRGCSVADVVAAARARGLQFLAITDHNTTSHHAELAGVQAAHDDLLLVRGQEVTTFRGHANVFGTSRIVDFRLGHAGRTARQLVEEVNALGALLSINHPGRETGAACTGCGWDAPDTPWGRVSVIEVVNGTTVEGPTAGVPFWYARLNDGHRVVAIGGSDDHGASQGRARIGTPTTVVYADRLDEEALLAGVRAGGVHIRTRGPEGPFLDMLARTGDRTAPMGGTLSVTGQTSVTFEVRTERAQGQSAALVCGGAIVTTATVQTDTLRLVHDVAPGDWCHVVLRDADGITAIGNPVFVR